MPIPKWKKFEELVADIQSVLVQENFIVKANDKIIGVDSETLRQVDVSIRGKVGQIDLLIVLEAKDKNIPVDIKGLEEFIGLAHDVRAHKAGMVSAKGFTKSAKTKAIKASIDMYTVLDTRDHEWQSVLKIPAICEITELKAFQIVFSTTSAIGFSFSAESMSNPKAVKLYDQDKRCLGTIDEHVKKCWTEGWLEFEAGSHKNVPIVPNPIWLEDASIPNRFAPMDIFAVMHVTKTVFLGTVPLKDVRGLKNELTGSASCVLSITAEELDSNWDQAGWVEIQDRSEVAVMPALEIRALSM